MPDQIRPEYRVKAERVLTSGGVSKNLGDGRVDYVLEAVAGVPVAVVEAKRRSESLGSALLPAARNEVFSALR